MGVAQEVGGWVCQRCVVAKRIGARKSSLHVQQAHVATLFWHLLMTGYDIIPPAHQR